MENRRLDTGVVVSSVAHVGLLLFALVSFSSSPKFDDALESVPVEMVTNQQFNDILKGEKTAKQIQKTPKAQKLADIAKIKPDTTTPKVQRDIVVPMPPLRREPDPGKAETPVPPVKTSPPPRPAVAKVIPPKPLPPKPLAARPLAAEPKQAEIIKPAPPKKAEPLKPKPPKEQLKPKKPEMKLADLRKFLAEQKQKDLPKSEPKKPAEKPKSGEAPNRTEAKLNLASIANLLNHDKAQQTASTGARLSQTASLGAKNASAARMSPNLKGQLGALIVEHFHQCWNTDGLPAPDGYMAQIEVHLRPDGSFSAPPHLLNPMSGGQSRSIGESALNAVQSCPPLNIPAQFAPYYSEWKDQFLRLKPENT